MAGRNASRTRPGVFVAVGALLASIAAPTYANPTTVDVLIAASADDAEETASGIVDLTSSDLELVTDGTKVQTVGMRFASVAIPVGATITAAWVQFQVDEVSTDAASLTLRGEAAGNAAQFQAVAFDVSSRARTTAAVDWTPPGWDIVGQAGADQRTPDLAGVISEIVAFPGWASGNALALLVNGAGRRTAEAFDGVGGPVLHVEYDAAPVEDTTPPSAPADLTASAPTGARVNLAWTASTDNIGVSSYTVLRDDVAVGSTTSTGFADQTVSPSTTYRYRVAASDAAGNVSQPSNEAVATTPAGATTIYFAAGGDFGANARTDASLAALDRTGVAFTLALGDFAYTDTATEQVWCDYVKARLPTLEPSFPFQLVVGDDEDDGSAKHIVNYAACLPDRLGSTLSPTNQYGAEYYFDYPQPAPLARVILIGADQKVNGIRYRYRATNARYRWLRDTIDAARTAGIPWVIVAMHEVCYTAGSKSCSVGADLMNLLFAKKVDLILQAHDHNYQRSKQVALNASTCPAVAPGSFNADCIVDDGSDALYAKGSGSVFMINGAFGGRGLSAVNPGDTEAGYFASLNSTTRGFTTFAITADSLQARFVNTIGSFVDAFEIRS